MTFIRLGKEREALTIRAEVYKEEITKYLESRGYTLDTDSGIEGIFEDQIYYKKDRKRINVECKDTEIGIGNTEFLIPLGRYLVLYAKLPIESRFQFSFFARKMSNYKEFNSLFNDLEDTKILELKRKCIVALEKTYKEKFIEIASDLEKIPLDTIRSFVYETEIVEADSEALKQATKIRLPDVGISSSILDILPHQNITEGLIQIAKPDKVEEILLSNLFPVSEYPKSIWGAKTDFRKKKDVFTDLESETLPTFILKEGMLYCFWNLNDDKNPFRSIVDINTITNHKISDWIEDPNKHTWVMDLLHVMIKNHTRTRNLKFDPKTSRFYIPAKLSEDKVIKWRPGTRSATRNMVKFYKNEAGEINFAAHRAACFKFEHIGDTFYLLIDPQWAFTEDGDTPVRGNDMNILSNKWRTKEYNSSFIRDVLFWANFLAKGDEQLVVKEGPTSMLISLKPIEVSLGLGIRDDNISLNNILIEKKDVIQPILSFERGQDDLLETEDESEESEYISMEEEKDE